MTTATQTELPTSTQQNGSVVPHTVRATLNYYLDPSKGGYESFWFGTVGEKRRPFAYIDSDIEDIRGRESEFKLDVHGFQHLREETKMRTEDYDSVQRIKEVCYPECAEIVKRMTGASRIHTMGHVVRRQTWDDFKDKTKGMGEMERMPAGTTARYVHVDYSYTGSHTRLVFYFPKEAEELKKKRWAIINTWRPLHPVTRENLCFADARSIPDSHLHPVLAKFLPPGNHENLSAETRAAFSRNDVETWSVAPPEKEGEHKWYYVKKMGPDEVLLIKIFDSEEKEGVARRSPHTSFVSPEDEGRSRESVEVRHLVFWDDDEEEEAAQ